MLVNVLWLPVVALDLVVDGEIELWSRWDNDIEVPLSVVLPKVVWCCWYHGELLLCEGVLLWKDLLYGDCDVVVVGEVEAVVCAKVEWSVGCLAMVTELFCVAAGRFGLLSTWIQWWCFG